MTNSTNPASAPHVHVDEATDADRRFVVRQSDNDVFVRSGRQVIQACRLDISIEVWLDELDAMIEYMNKWCQERARTIRSCYSFPLGGRINLFVAPHTNTYDFDLTNALVDLNVELMRAFKIGQLEIHQIPYLQMDRFLDPSQARLVYGEPSGSHQTVDA